MKKLMVMLSVFLCVAGMSFASGSQETQGGEKVHLVFCESNTSPGRTAVIQSLIDEYEAANPNVDIELVSPPYEQADNKITMMLNSSQQLDIVEVRDMTHKQYVNNGNLLDLTPYLESWDERGDYMDLPYQMSCNVDETPYILTHCLYLKALLVRTDILEEYGIEIPTTMNEMFEAAKTLTAKGNNQYGYAFRGKSNTYKISDNIMFGNVGNIDPEMCYQTTDGKFWLDSDAGRAVLEQYVDLYKNGSPADSINWGFNEQINGFVSGTTPFLIQDPDVIGSLEGQLDPALYETVPLPVGSTGKRYIDVGYNGFAITSSCEHPDEAWAFISWLCGAEKNAELCKAYGPLPVFQSTYDTDDYFSSDKYQAWADELVDPNTVVVNYPLDSALFPGWGQVNEQAMQALLMGNATVEDTINTFKEYWGY